MTRAMLVVRDLNLGGIQLMSLRLLRGLGVETSLCVIGEHRVLTPADLPDEDVGVALTALRQPRGRSATSGQVAFLRSAIRKVRPDVLLSLGYSTSALSASVAVNVPLVAGVRNSPIETDGSGARAVLKQRWIKWGLGRADRIVCISTPLADELVARSWAASSKIEVVLNGIDVAHVQHLGCQPLPAGLTLPSRYLVGVGRLSQQKDFALLVAGLAACRDEDTLHLVLIGEGEEADRLLTQAERTGIAERVHLLGRLENPFPVLKRAEAFVLSSQYEGFGTVLVEALALGVPAVSMDCPSGPGEILGGGKYGELVAERTPVALAEGIARVLEPARCAAVRAEASLRAEDFSLERMIDGYSRLLAGVAAHGQRAAQPGTMYPVRAARWWDRS